MILDQMYLNVAEWQEGRKAALRVAAGNYTTVKVTVASLGMTKEEPDESTQGGS